MFINLEILNKKDLSLHEIALLQVIKQNKLNDCSEFIKNNLAEETKSKFESLALIDYTKKGKMNTTKKGNEWLEDVGTAEVTEDSLRIFEWIKNIYLFQGKSLGNQKKTKTFIAQFSAESGIEKNCFAFLIQTFVNDEKEMEYSKVLQYLFFKGDSVFSTRFDLHGSRLYQYYLKHEEEFKEEFKKLEKDAKIN